MIYMKNKHYTPLAAASGGLLATMIFLNGMLSRYTNPFLSSFIVHIVGLLSSLILWFVINYSKKINLVSKKVPFWVYLGGIAGAFAVVTANIAVNSPLGLAGSLSCFILGQTVTTLFIDRLGLLGSGKRKLTYLDGIRVSLILIGSLLIINAGGQS
jgi:bacterial/archaeal transporter family-2 protein